jgi:alanine racemase
MHCWIEVKRSALEHNYRTLSSLADSAILCAVIKSNAYGHGISEVYECLKSFHPKYLAVAYLEEAELLRRLGFHNRLMVVTPVSPQEFEFACQLKAEILMTDPGLWASWLASKHKPQFHLKVDTGLTRQGFFNEQIKGFIPQLQQYKASMVGVCTHFANVEDVLEHAYADLQLQRFAEVRQWLKAASIDVLEHAASSASTLILAESRLGMCRTGISLYGYWPSSMTKLSYHKLNDRVIELRPALMWKTRVSQIKDVPAGAYVGYGCSFKAMNPMRVAVLPIGYFEGYSRMIADAKSYVLIAGQRCQIVGRISMNLMVVDITSVESVAIDDEVVLIGSQGSESITAEQVSDWAKTIQYELVTRIHSSIPRIVVA